MKKLTVILVNYNVRYFLELALDSVQRACRHIDAHVVVVDNASADDSEAYIRKRFPSVEYIYSNENLGFSKANNLAMRQAHSEYVLLLNPDTVIAEDNLEKAIAFMDAHPDAGALGIKMLDGSGQFLPESKRGLPRPSVAFYKLSGLSSLFPKSRKFGQYHLAYLSKEENHLVDVLAGAYMLMRKTALDKAGLLDETFFMYGEDIDLSYRIQLAGFHCYYFSESPILHFKGESTRKSSVNYVRVFYQAMAIFAKKHFSSGQARLLSFFIQIGIVLKALFTVVRNFLQSANIILLDAALGWLSMQALKVIWAVKVMGNPNHFPAAFGTYLIPIMIAIWLVVSFFSGVYDKPYKLSKIIRGILVGTLLIAAVYGFLPEAWRFSRTLIALGGLSMMLLMIADRWLFNLLMHRKLFLDDEKINSLIVGRKEEGGRVLALMNRYSSQNVFYGYVSPDADSSPDSLGHLSQLDEIVEAMDVQHIVFCAADIPYKEIIAWMEKLQGKTAFQIVVKEADCILGSSNKNTAGEISAEDVNLQILLPKNRRNKRLLDIAMSLLMLIGWPFFLFFVRNKGSWLSHLFQVLFGQKGWVGYCHPIDKNLPALRPGIIPLSRSTDADLCRKANWHYARNYNPYKDLGMIWHHMKDWGGIE